MTFGLADGGSVIAGASRGAPVVAVMGILNKSPYDITFRAAGGFYLARLNTPTDWTKFSVSGSVGFLATLRFDCDPAVDATLLDKLNAAVSTLLLCAGIVAGHVSRADLAISTAETAEQKGRPDNAAPRWVVLVEASTREAARAALAGRLGTEKLAEFAFL